MSIVFSQAKRYSERESSIIEESVTMEALWNLNGVCEGLTDVCDVFVMSLLLWLECFTM